MTFLLYQFKKLQGLDNDTELYWFQSRACMIYTSVIFPAMDVDVARLDCNETEPTMTCQAVVKFLSTVNNRPLYEQGMKSSNCL